VPESTPHDAAAEHIRQLLLAWTDRLTRPVAIARNLAVRWLERMPRVGIDPDVCVLDPSPPGFERLTALCAWKAGHVVPRLCFEVVSQNHPYKDYRDVHERYAAMGTQELVVFDPSRVGPASLGGPVALQLWRRDAQGSFERVVAGDGPIYSEVLQAWIAADDRHVTLSSDRAGEQRWPTRLERERAEKERERAEKERERAEKERERASREEWERKARDFEQRLNALERERT
jgi:hypothetical protein